MEERPRNCPNRRCLCLFHTYDEEERICFGVLPQEDWVDHDGLLDFMRRCEDGEPMDFNLPDAFYESKGFLRCLVYGLKNGLPNACGEVAIADPLRKLMQILQGEG